MQQSNLAKERPSEIPDYVKGQIYLITNTVNDKKYVGQTRTHVWNHGKYRSFGYKKRHADHVSEAINNVKKNQCTHLNCAIRKHGPKAFKVELIVDGCELSQLDELEAKYIDKYSSLNETGNGYNLTKGGQFTARTTKESRKKISETLKKRFESDDAKQNLSAIHWRTYDNRKYAKLVEYDINCIEIVLGTGDIKIIANLYTDDVYKSQITMSGKWVTMSDAMIRMAIVAKKRELDDVDVVITIDKRIKQELGIKSIADIDIPEDFYPERVKKIKPRARPDTYTQKNIESREDRFREMEISHLTIAMRSVKGYKVVQFDIYEYCGIGKPLQKHQSTFGGKHGAFEDWCEKAVEFMKFLYLEANITPDRVRILRGLKNYMKTINKNHPIIKIKDCHWIFQDNQ